MINKTLTVRSAPLPNQHCVFTEKGEKLPIPEGWSCLKPGDAAITRTLKSLGPSWTAQRKKGRKTFSDGVWAPTANIKKAQEMVAEKRATPAYEKTRASALKYRAKKQADYEISFTKAITNWLHFHPDHKELAEQLAIAISNHATPVGSGTVARTQLIPIEQRAEAAVIAWMRHKTTGYDNMIIARTKGRRREVRRELAQKSRQLLKPYRDGSPVSPCLLSAALRPKD